MAEPGRKRRVSNDELIAVFRDADDPVLTSREVSESVSIGHSGVKKRLDALHDDERLHKKKVGGRATVWWVPDTGKMEGISRRHGDDHYGENPDWADDLLDLGENA